MTVAIKTKELTKYYGKARGIVDVSFAIEEGDIFGFIGPNGAGKSTTIRALLGLIKPSSGMGEVLGYDCVSQKKEILREIGYMPSEAMFYPNMRVSDVIKFSAKLHGRDCKKEAEVLCERFGLDVRKKIEELSLGNRKKVSIVCAMQHRPMLYILDEPTSGLDPLMQHEFFEILHERNKEGATIFLSSHVLSEIAKHCNNAAVIREGRLIAVDAVDALTQSSAKRIVLHGVAEAPQIVGVTDVEKTDEMVTFLYKGEIPVLLENLNGLPIKDMNMTEPDLEEMFMHFYGGEN